MQCEVIYVAYKILTEGLVVLKVDLKQYKELIFENQKQIRFFTF